MDYCLNTVLRIAPNTYNYLVNAFAKARLLYERLEHDRLRRWWVLPNFRDRHLKTNYRATRIIKPEPPPTSRTYCKTQPTRNSERSKSRLIFKHLQIQNYPMNIFYFWPYVSWKLKQYKLFKNIKNWRHYSRWHRSLLEKRVSLTESRYLYWRIWPKKNYFLIREYCGYNVAYGFFYILRKWRSVNEILFSHKNLTTTKSNIIILINVSQKSFATL